LSKQTFKDETGAVLLIVAAALTAIILIAAFVIDAANWFEHKRHLQLQADAAALAGGAAFQNPGCNNATIYAAARQYAGVKDASYTAPYNGQVGSTPDANAHVLVNSTNYYRNGGTDYSDGQPCTSSFVDVKMTETNLPWFLGNALVPTINAHARVSINTVNTLSGQWPLGVPDVNPLSGAVIFYDEANPGSLATTYAKYLRHLGTANGLNEWSNTDSSGTATPASVTMPGSGQLGSVVAFSSDGPPSRPPMSIAGMTVTQICAQARVDCYPDPASSGLLYLHGYSKAAAAKPPVVRAATLSTANCPDSYAYFTYNDASCAATLSVRFDSTITDLTNVQLTATAGGNCSGGGSNNTASNTRTFSITIPAHAGPCPITVTWIVRKETGLRPAPLACSNNFNGNPPAECQGSFGVVQRAYGGDDDFSGPIRTAHLINAGAAFTHQLGTCNGPLVYGPTCNTFPIGDTHNLAVDVQLTGAVSTANSDPPVFLRIVRGSRNSALDCNQTGNFRQQIAAGCKPPYTVNTDPNLACPWGSKPAMFSVTLPNGYPCVWIQPGASVGQFTQGIQDRIFGGSNQCPATGAGRNYWSRYPATPFPTTQTDGFNDTRVVYVFMVPFGSFRGSGNAVLPIVSFGVFYVRGWGGNGNGNNDPCPGAIPNVPTGDLAGNFITHVATSAGASGSRPCNVGGFNPCVAVLSK
jgi:Putative Flp pilus-assembly TadE/G-like